MERQLKLQVIVVQLLQKCYGNQFYNRIYKEGEMMIMNDRKVKHYVSNITRQDSSTKGYRDILVMTSVF